MLHSSCSQMSNVPNRAVRAAQAGAVINLALAVVKIAAGVVGHAYALVADGVESLADVASSLVVWSGIAVGGRPADEDHPYGHGKAEALAAVAVSLLFVAAAGVIGTQSIREIRTPHAFPATWTLAVLLVVVAVKALLHRHVVSVGADTGSVAVEADAMHHLSDAITSGAAFFGIGAALLGQYLHLGANWAAADDWAALLASVVIARNGIIMSLAGVHDLMDRSPGDAVLIPLRAAAMSVPGVTDIEQLAARRVGTSYRVMVHVQADGGMRLADAHVLSGRVKGAMRAAVPAVSSVLVHMEPDR